MILSYCAEQKQVKRYADGRPMKAHILLTYQKAAINHAANFNIHNYYISAKLILQETIFARICYNSQHA